MNTFTSLVSDRSGDLLLPDRSREDLRASPRLVATLRTLSIDAVEHVLKAHRFEIETLAGVARGVAAGTAPGRISLRSVADNNAGDATQQSKPEAAR